MEVLTLLRLPLPDTDVQASIHFQIRLKSVLPNNFLSVGAAISLLADSNLLEAEEPALSGRALNQTATHLQRPKSSIVKMGWFARKRDEERVWTINNVDDQAFSQEQDDSSSGIPLRTLPIATMAPRRGFRMLSP